MCNGLIGKKIGMTAVYDAEGRRIPVTVIQLGPCVVTQVKTDALDGYNALQLGFGTRHKSRLNKPMAGHLKKSGQGPFEVLKEFPSTAASDYQVGQTVPLDIFKVGEKVDVTGTIKGRGYQGVIKRHGFSGGKKTHGSRSHRVPGSIGCSAWPAKVIKGKKLPGQYGNTRKTVSNLEIIDIRPQENLVMVKGAVPGFASSLLTVRKSRGNR